MNSGQPDIDELRNLIGRVKANRAIHPTEEATKQGLILPIVQSLGWDVFNIDEVYPEYALDTRRVDYSLRHGGINRVFIEAKHTETDLENHQEQLLNYSFKAGVGIAVLTNGFSWWFFLPIIEGVHWADRRFITIHIPQQEEDDVCSNFVRFLSKTQVISGDAERSARELQGSQARLIKMKAAIPRAWQDIVNDPEGLLYELVAEETERLSGHRPGSDLILSFLQGHLPQFFSQGEQALSPPSRARGRIAETQGEADERSRLLNAPSDGVGDRRASGTTDRPDVTLKAVREVEKRLTTKLSATTVARGRNKYFASTDQSLYVLVLASKYYEQGQQYWFGLRIRQIEFLDSREVSHLALVCGDQNVFVKEWRGFKPWIEKMNVTRESGTVQYYHIKIFKRDRRFILGLPELAGGQDISHLFSKC